MNRRSQAAIYNDKENNEHLDSVLFASSKAATAGVMDRTSKLTREEQLLQWKQARPGVASKVPSAKAALQKANPNVVKVKSTQSKTKGEKNASSKTSKAGTRNTKDIENEKHLESSKRSRVDVQSSQESQDEKCGICSDEDDAFDPTLLDTTNVRGVLDALDENVERDLQMQGGGTRDASESRIAPLPPNAGKGPIARLQTALAARNDDIRALQERLAIEMSRADRSEIDAESRRRDAEEARLLTLELKKMLMEADRRMLDKEDLLDELERKLLRQENEHSKKIAALEKQLTKLQEETQDTPRTLSNDHNAVIVELQNSLTDAAREQARLAQELVAKDDEQTALRMSCEEMIKSAQKSANSSQDQLRDLQLQLESVVNNDEELASIWEYVRNVRDEDCPSQDASLLSYVRQTVEEGRLAVARLMEEKTALTAELEECGFALEEMEEKLMTSDDASEKHLEVLARAEDLQSQLLSREVELWRVRDELTQANQTVDELRLTLDKVLDENQALTSAAEAGFRLEDDENRHSAVKRPVSEDRHPTDSLDSVAGFLPDVTAEPPN